MTLHPCQWMRSANCRDHTWPNLKVQTIGPEANRHVLAVVVLGWILFLHLSGLSLFTRGFLLTRLALESKTSCSPYSSCTLPATHKRAVLLIIDALRFDFISPNPPNVTSTHFHNVLTLPRQLSASRPQHSFIFNAYSDPPTTTLQRIKGVTTGSLPTFVDIGSSFSASPIEEDSIISQLRAIGKTISFAGDDTWLTVFSRSFAPNMSFPYDSFNVEDLHSVDEGVIRHMFPLLRNEEAGWHFFIGHFLGVDHVGHRLGPDHPTMKAKLKQMDQMLRNVVDALDDETLLVVLGDHGMDSKGDHGGDGALETDSALWFYSKNIPLSTSNSNVAADMQTFRTFPGSLTPHRSVQQIDVVPSISLLLGLPIPFNNLGSIIPELFLRSLSDSNGLDILSTAARLNAEQVMSYLRAYRASASGAEIDGSWPTLEAAYIEAAVANVPEQYFSFTRKALAECRLLWAQFNSPLMISGLAILIGSLPAFVLVYSALAIQRDRWEEVGQAVLILGWGGALVGVILGIGIGYALPGIRPGWSAFSFVDVTIVMSAATSELSVFVVNFLPIFRALRRSFYRASKASTLLPVFLLALHSLSFASNSFTMWEDRLVLFLLITLIVPMIVSSLSYPSARLRKRIFLHFGIFAVCARLMSISTVCREEQHPYCHVTFYSSSTRPLSPLLVLLLVLPTVLFLPAVVRRFLSQSKSDKGAAPFSIEVIWRSFLIGGSLYWIIEWIESVYGQAADRDVGAGTRRPPWVAFSLLIRTALARIVLVGTLMVGYVFWWYSPLNIETIAEEGNQEDAVVGRSATKRIVVIGYANAYGSTFLLFLLPFFALLWTVTQLTGQLVLALSLIAILCYAEAVDSVRDSRALSASVEGLDATRSSIDVVIDSTSSATPATIRARSPTFAEPVAFSLLGHILFFSTGHQSVLSSIQWKTAFVGFPILTYPFSPALVSLNSFGPFLLPALALPLLSTWAVSPVPRGRVLVLSDTMRSAVGMQICFTALLVGAATSAAVLRRHLMVWKVFAPRFMLAGIALLAVDLVVILAVLVGGARAVHKVRRVFATDV
ncbi:hypothetical protein BS47DRAFT_988449 [Hydnum rufescens UP504]|uniref:GPI ethanolamine phosphate transferase 3 n=1 Tax=Hydnum rufescens UP504 TaxID=1448309 RepID=A0A9P6DVW6_9AGAM|nr:hypothetical protein BS47DRAFT_988449 [Hydnum rufescens UP504]